MERMNGDQKRRTRNVISTGSLEIDRRMGGGIPYGTLMLIEGPAASGKSTLSQQLLWGALTSGEDAVVYTTEQTVHSLLRQMDSLGLGVTDHFLLNDLKIYPVSIPPGSIEPRLLFAELSRHMASQDNCRVMVVDALTTFVAHAGGGQIQDFFSGCKSLCDLGKVIIFTVHSLAFEETILTRVRSMCDTYLRLQVQRTGSQLLKTMEVAKIRGAEITTGNVSGFEVEPGMGIRVIPISRARG